jgi:alkylation response protein AidB-like acyl-CoA dehydrogenase
MPIAVLEEHEGLRQTVRRWLDAHCPPEVPRASLDLEAGELPPVWKELADQGWLGLHVPEELGGQGFGAAELAVVLDEFGYSLVPGPVLSTVLVSAALAAEVAAAADGAPALAALLSGLADGSTPAGVSLGPGALEADQSGGATTVTGVLAPVLGAPTARLLLVPVADLGWCLIDADAVTIEAQPALDATRPLGSVAANGVPVDPGQVFRAVDRDAINDIALAFAAAESAGAARWCLDTTSDYAKVRVQFGRPIGQFQAVKHRLSDMLVSVEQATASAWDAAQALAADPDERALSAAVAGGVAIEGFATCTKDCVQLHGGIGFTWEHDAHLYLKRALAGRALLGNQDIHDERVVQLALAGARRAITADLPAEADDLRESLRPLVEGAAALEGDEQRAYLVEHGLISPHWPAPWGRDAGPLEQLVLDDLIASLGVMRPHLAVGAWALPTIITHGTAEQQERWVRPSLMGQINWCQLFSEPGAGSDLASLATRAERVDGGWVLNGQKVWTSLAHIAHFGICLARTDPDVPKHQGITYFIVDMASEGIEIRPLRELTGEAMFNEVFFTSVFVPDDCVIGGIGAGWGIARTTLANERVSMSSGSSFGIGVEQLLRRLERMGESATTSERLRVGHLLSEAQSLHLMQHRSLLLTLSGLDPGPGASVRKLLGAEHEQRVQETGLELAAAAGAVLEGGPARWAQGFLATRCLTIAGGTSEVQRNVIAERLLGQPKDPEPGA